MAVRLGPVLPEDYVRGIEWVDEKPRFSRTYGRRPKPVYFEIERRQNISNVPDSLPDGIYPLIGIFGYEAIFYNYANNQGVSFDVGNLKKTRNSGWRAGIPRYVVIESSR